MKKLITAVLLVVALLAVTNVSYADSLHIGGTTSITNKGGEGGKGGNASANANIGDIKNKNTNENKNKNINENKNKNINENKNKNINENKNKNVNDNSNQNSNIQGQQQGQQQGQLQGQGQVNEGNQNQINISDNSSYTEINPTDLLNPTNPLAEPEKLTEDEMHISKSIFDLQRNSYNYKELTRFANPGRFLGILWPEWDNTYQIEIATFAKYKAQRSIRVLPAGLVRVMGMTKIGEGQAFAKDLNKSEHQVMAAVAFRAAQAGATVIVYKGFSNPLVKVDSFVIGGGGTQVGSPQSIFNGAAGIGTSSSETLTRANVLVELYR